MAAATKYALAATGTTANTTHASVSLADHAAGPVAIQLVVEAIGATPTITFTVSGSLDADTLTDSAATWFPITYVTDANDTVSAAAVVSTTVVTKVIFFDHNSYIRSYKRFRLVTTAITNVTYRAELYAFEG